MSLRHFNFIHWPISTKLVAIFVVLTFLPTMLILVIFTGQRRDNMARDQNEQYLKTLAPLVITRTGQTLQGFATDADRILSKPANLEPFEQYLTAVQAAQSESQIRRARISSEARISALFAEYPYLSRIRLLDDQYTLLVSGLKRTGVIQFRYEASSLITTPAEQILAAGAYGPHVTVSTIYANDINDPSLDVLYLLDDGSASGYMILTYNLRAAANTRPQLDLFAELERLPTGEQETRVFLLNPEGALLSVIPDIPFLANDSTSGGFEAAQRGETGVSIYDSALLDTSVMGYHTKVQFPDGPTLTVLLETRMADITQASREESLWSMVVIGGSILLLGSLTIVVGTRVIARPLARLTDAAHQIAAGKLDVRLPHMTRRDEIGVLNNTFEQMTDQVVNAISELESRVAERTRTLETILEVGRIITSIRDLDVLLEEVVNVIRDQFVQIYHVQIFLIDRRTNQARLRASTGTAGRQLLERGHYLEVGSQSVIGQVTAQNLAMVVSNISLNPVHRRNEFLPDTNAEMALPLQVGGVSIGALDLQSKEVNAFSQQDVDLFQGMADQISVAIENALLFAESSARLQEIERLNRTLTRTAWEEIERQHHKALSANSGPPAPDTEDWTPIQRQAMQTKDTVEHTEGTTVTLAVPIIRRDQVLGAIEWQIPTERYSHNVRQTAIELATRLALTADNIRLFEQSRRAAQRESLVNQIAGNVIGTTDINQILQTTIRELGQALNIPHTAIRLVPPATDSTQPNDNG